MHRAASLAEQILSKHKVNIASVELLPSSGGIFEVAVGGRILFSKRQTGRFPNQGEAESLVDQAVAGAAAIR